MGMALYVAVRRGPWHHVLGLAGFSLLLLRPNLFFQQGFWLSFYAVGLLAFVFAPRMRRMSYVGATLVAQMIMFVGMSPLIAYLSGFVPLVSPIANLFAVPLMSLCVIPAAMLGFALQSILPALAAVLLGCADQVLNLVIHLLERLKDWELLRLDPLDASAALAAGWPVALVFLPLRRLHRCLMVCVWFLAMTRSPAMPQWGEFRVIVLDVGQGSAALIDTARHRLALDSGPAYPGGYDAGVQVVLPALSITGRKQLDRLVISHEDLDHGGGADAIIQRFPRVDVIRQDDCPSGRKWHWDGVHFELLRNESGRSRNAGSCTVLVRSANATAFFPGDIDAASELVLKKKLPRSIDLMTAPHHGSRTSSHPAFVKHLRPDVVLFSVGYKNRYGHPDAVVLGRYVRRGSTVMTTAETGAVVWSSADGSVSTYRTQLWGHHLPLVSKVDE